MAKRPSPASTAPTEGYLEAVVRDALHKAGADQAPEAAARALIPVLATWMARIPNARQRGAIMSTLHLQVGAAIADLPTFDPPKPLT